MLCMGAMCVVSIQWVLFGYSLCFSEWDTDGSGSVFIGDAKYFGLKNVNQVPLLKTAPTVSGITFSIYQMQFATITAALIFGSIVERVRFLPSMLFVFVWTTLIYDPIAYWTWSWRGWIHNLSCLNTAGGDTPCGTGGIDFAGGGPVHMASGFAGLAFCLYLGRRITEKPDDAKKSSKEGSVKSSAMGAHDFQPHHVVNIMIGTALLWFGWFAFNGGSALAGSARAGMAAACTHIATATAAMTWPLMDYLIGSFIRMKARSQLKKAGNTDDEIESAKFSAIGFCSGAVAGLVAITPAAGFVEPWAAIAIGFLAAVICNLCCHIKIFFGFDDTLDAWAVHGVGGFLGSILTGVFSQAVVPINLDATTTVLGGWVDGNWRQVLWQLEGSLAIMAYAFVGTFILVFIIDHIPGCKLRMTPKEEWAGGDKSEMGDVAFHYATEYIEQQLESLRSNWHIPHASEGNV